MQSIFYIYVQKAVGQTRKTENATKTDTFSQNGVLINVMNVMCFLYFFHYVTQKVRCVQREKVKSL